MKKRKKTPRSRLNMQVPPALLSWAKEYAKKNGTTVTNLFVSHLRDLQARDIPQI